MITATIIGIAAVVLFAAAYLTGRRFGALGLALGSGALISQMWASDLVPFVEGSDFDVASVSTAGLVAAGLVIAPSLLLLMSGPVYKGKLGRLVGSLLYVILAVTLLVEPLGSAFVLEGVWLDAYDFVTEYRIYIISAGLILALFDLFGAQGKHAKLERHSKRKGSH